MHLFVSWLFVSFIESLLEYKLTLSRELTELHDRISAFESIYVTYVLINQINRNRTLLLHLSTEAYISSHNLAVQAFEEKKKPNKISKNKF